MAIGRKTGGRVKGTPNKSTAERRERVSAVLNLLFESVEVDIKQLSPKDRTNLLTDLLEFDIPKLNRTEVKQEGDNQLIIKVIEDDNFTKPTS